MSETRAKITAEELHKTCKPRNARCDRFENMPECEYKEMCGGRWPAFWDLTDPPRFNEAQMAALQESYASGVTEISKTKYALHFVIPSIMSEIVVGNIGLTDILEVGETLDLAELLGKDGAEC